MSTSGILDADSNQQKLRIGHLEGLRGISALFVVNYHMMLAFSCTLDPQPPVSVLFDGEFHVLIFFIISGQALTQSYVSKEGDWRIIKSAMCRRGVRLILPIFAALLIAYVLRTVDYIGLMRYEEYTSEICKNPGWNYVTTTRTGSILDDLVDLFKMMFYAGPMIDFQAGVLWTMPIEFLQSYIIFMIAFFANYFEKNGSGIAFIVTMCMLAFFTRLDTLLFIVGYLFSIAEKENYFKKLTRRWQSMFYRVFLELSLPLTVLYLAIAQPDSMIVLEKFLERFSFNKHIGKKDCLLTYSCGASPRFFYLIWAVLLVAFVTNSKKAKKVLNYKVISFLGKISFGVYLMHGSVLPVAAMCFALFIKIGIAPWASMILARILCLFPLSIFLGYLFYFYIDLPIVKYTRTFYEYLCVRDVRSA